MLYLKSLTIDKLRSFKHAEIMFSKGFTCVVGPNGSGKSSICDALFLGLGESALSRFKLNKYEDLINWSIKKKKDEVTKAYVKIELGGDSDYVIVRTIRSDGKTEFTVNGKHLPKHEVMEILSRNGVAIDETNTIAQGEINNITSLSPKEQRELIDIASGIKDFEAKKTDALRELDKVGQKIAEMQGMLNEKMSFLRELEKEKESAEKYSTLTTKLKSLRYSILVARKDNLKTVLDGSTKEMAVVDSRKNDTELKRSEIAKKMADFEMERQQITHELTTSTASMSEINAKFDSINKELATLEAEISGHKSALIEIATFTEESEAELSRINETLKAGSISTIEINKRLTELHDEGVAASTPAESVDKTEKEVETINKSIQRLEKQVVDAQNLLMKLNTESSIVAQAKGDIESAVERYTSLVKEKEPEPARLSKELDEARKQAKAAAEAAKQGDLEHARMEKEIDSVDEKLISLKEQRSDVVARSGNLLEKIGVEFPESKGFYGRVLQLCTYDTEHSVAIETAAGSRFEYFVVDTIGTADKIISYLKKNQLGRATFIPIKDIRADDRESSEKGMTSVISQIKYDKKFERVFKYVFSNSYIIEKVEDANKFGIGKHRYVTLDGELIESSGTVAGGYAKRRLSLASLENQIRELDERKKTLHDDRTKAEEKAFAGRKAQASVEMRLGSQEKELAAAQSDLNNAKKALDDSNSRLKESTKRIADLKQKVMEGEKEKESAERELNSSKGRLREIYNDAIEATKEAAKHGMTKAEREKAEKLRKELEALKIKAAEINKEAELLEARRAELEKQLAEKRKLAKSINDSVKQKSDRIVVLAKEKKEVDFKAKNSGASNAKGYERLNKITDELTSLGADNGRINAELNEIDRHMSDIKVKRSQTDTRLNDITAELSAFGTGAELIKGDVDIMEREAVVAQSRLAELGTVNMKAPELYEEKKKNVDEALIKANTLEVEKQAVIGMIEEIDSKKLQVFMNTYNEVNKNFSKLYNYIFPGKAWIELENPNEPFSGGIEIKISDAKLNKRLGSMSGGEKSLILMMMIFAIHLCKPASLYIFDEVDSALDKENSKKLSLLIKQMSKEAQFVVVSHNDSLIVNADTAVGVVKMEGESKAVGLDVSSLAKAKQ